jgi:NitT/TauT family transport system permease protein
MMITKPPPLSLSELQSIEERPKQVADKIRDRVACALPLLVTLTILLVYLAVPNHIMAVPALYLYKPSHVYTVFISAFILAFLVWNVIALFNSKAYKKLRNSAPLFTAVFMDLLFYDVLTLKTNVLKLPFFPWIDAILSAIVTDREIMLDATANSLTLLFLGYFSGAAVGITMGIFAGVNKRVRYWVTPLVKFMGTIPATTYIPILVVLPFSFFIDRILLIAIGVWYPVAMTTLNGVLNVPESHFEAAKTFGATRRDLLFHVAIPSSLPFVFQGLVQGMTIACTLLLIAEGLGVRAGIGLYINSATATTSFANIFGALVVLCSIFFAVNAVLGAVKKRVLRWQPPRK